MPILIFQTHPTLLTLRGGTNVSFSPPIDHFQHILLPLLSKMGINAQLASDHRRGYYPVGGGKVQISIDGNGVLHPIILTEPGKVESIICVIFGNNDEIQLSLKSHLECALGEYISLIGERISSNFEGIRIVLNTLTPQSQQEKRSNSQGKSSSKIGNKKKKIVNSSVGVQIIISTSTGNILSANSLICERDDDLLQCAPLNITTDIMNQLKNLIESGSCIDEHTADQLLVYMALANSCADTSTPGSMKESILVIEPFIEGKSSQHLETSVYLLNQILGPRGCRVNLEIDPITRCRIITCVGIGYLPC